ncbi:MAG: valine--tRNA ligase [Gammaproteobacteria bacterium]|nr:valine--tRNA ligase [Gammaproteobacteria bacterium]
MDKTYDPADIEPRIYQLWEDSGLFAPNGDGPGYCIVIPPPNVTGTLHMGHAFQDTIMDALTRYHRMRGDATLWQPGTDHAGIATQMVVERQLEGTGETRANLGREAFIKRVWKWKEESGGTISNQMRRLGTSVDWSRECFTMDQKLSNTVTEVFVRMYQEGLIYRGKRLVNWDPSLQTAVSDLEVINIEEEGSLWHLKYPLQDKSGFIVVATTRPETLLGDSAVAVNPKDERYIHLIGKQVRLPLTDRLIPIIADDYVDPKFGSGCVKITPAHDFNDYEVGLRHNLEQINILTPDAKMNDEVPVEFRGLDLLSARKKVIQALVALNLIDRIVSHHVMVPHGDRSGAIIEPYLTDQWYVRVAPLAGPAIKAVETGEINFIPENWSRTYFDWMRNIKDWCISRQLWWGHRIPAWYDIQGHVYVGRTEAEVRSTHNLKKDYLLSQDNDVLDTWFSSSLWPFSTLGWPEQTPEFKKFYPTSVLVTGFDIIFFWVARMIMMGIKFTGTVPFKEVYVHGLVRDSEGQKMSKSKGNVIDPLDIIDGIKLEALVQKRTTNLMQPRLAESIEKSTRKAFPEGITAHGTDALRFTFASLATQSIDLRFDLARVGGYRNFCNKLWNASRFVLMMIEPVKNLEEEKFCQKSTSALNTINLGIADIWIRSRLGVMLKNVESAYGEYRFDFVASALYEFTWYEFCDWYLELTKPILQSEHSTEEAKNAARETLTLVLEVLLRALHPLMPFITEEIWQRVAPFAGLMPTPNFMIMQAPWPEANEWPQDKIAEADVNWIKNVILGIRQIRGEMDISPARRLPVLLENASVEDRRRLAIYEHYLARLAGLESVRTLTDEESAPPSATALIGNMRALVPMAGLIDPEAESARLEKRATKINGEIKRSRSKLLNENFTRNAPHDVVLQEQDRIADFEQTLTSLEEQIKRVKQLL